MTREGKTDASFEAIGHDDTPGFGKRTLLAVGIPQEQRGAFRGMIDELGLERLPLRHVEKLDLFRPLGVLVGLRGEGEAPVMGAVPPGDLPRAIVLSGLSDGETHRIMDAYRGMGWPSPLWAALTPTSAEWPLGKLLVELHRERVAMARLREAGSSTPTDA